MTNSLDRENPDDRVMPQLVEPAREPVARGSTPNIGVPPVRSQPEHEPHDPDGIPSDVVGWLVFVDVLLAGTILIALITGSLVLVFGACLLLLSILVRLLRRSRRERRELYPDVTDLQE